MDLIVVESPTKSKTLSKFLGTDYKVLATMGHIKDLPKSKFAVDLEKDFEPGYEWVAKKSDVVAEIKAASKKASKIYLATDPDREGEAISEHVAEIVGKKNVKRIVFHEITKEAVEEALAHPREIDSNLVNAQIARRVLDRIVGYKLSPLLWKKVRRGLSSGRVQTVAVRLIVEKEKEIEAFSPVEYWDISALVKSKKASQEVLTQLVKINDKKSNVKNKSEADGVVADIANNKFIVEKLEKREVVKSPYAPFTTSTLTQAASRLFGWSAKRTMGVAQGLYEQGLITYHRTDSTNLSFSAVTKVRDYIGKEYGEKFLSKSVRVFKTKAKSAQEAHEAVRPTDATKAKSQIDALVRDGQKLYDLIWKRFVACQMSEAIFDETTLDVVVTNKNSYLFRTVGQIMIFDGWRILFKKSEDEVQALPVLEKGEVLDLIKLTPEQKFTQPPPRYTEASLIKTLEKLGIGRPSTYAPIITTIQVRQYVEKKEGKFYATPVGTATNDFLIPNFENIFEYGFTAEMEKSLDDVAEGKKKWRKEISVFYTPFSKILARVEKNAKRVKIETEKLGRKCPTCKDGELVVRIGRFGKFISCSKFPDCKYTEKYVEKLGMKCPDCGKGDVVIKFSKTRRRFFGCSRYPDCKWASWRKPLVTTEKV